MATTSSPKAGHSGEGVAGGVSRGAMHTELPLNEAAIASVCAPPSEYLSAVWIELQCSEQRLHHAICATGLVFGPPIALLGLIHGFNFARS